MKTFHGRSVTTTVVSWVQFARLVVTQDAGYKYHELCTYRVTPWFTHFSKLIALSFGLGWKNKHKTYWCMITNTSLIFTLCKNTADISRMKFGLFTLSIYVLVYLLSLWLWNTRKQNTYWNSHWENRHFRKKLHLNTFLIYFYHLHTFIT